MSTRWSVVSSAGKSHRGILSTSQEIDCEKRWSQFEWLYARCDCPSPRVTGPGTKRRIPRRRFRCPRLPNRRKSRPKELRQGSSLLPQRIWDIEQWFHWVWKEMAIDEAEGEQERSIKKSFFLQTKGLLSLTLLAHLRRVLHSSSRLGFDIVLDFILLPARAKN